MHAIRQRFNLYAANGQDVRRVFAATGGQIVDRRGVKLEIGVQHGPRYVLHPFVTALISNAMQGSRFGAEKSHTGAPIYTGLTTGLATSPRHSSDLAIDHQLPGGSCEGPA
jgi:hypothetical protein